MESLSTFSFTKIYSIINNNTSAKNPKGRLLLLKVKTTGNGLHIYNKLRMVIVMKRLLSIVTCSIFILLASSIYSSCYAAPTGLTSEQMKSEIEILEVFNKKMNIVIDLSKIIAESLNKPYNGDESEQKIISNLYKADDLLSKLLESELPIPNTTSERKRIYISCFSALDDICISGRHLDEAVINYRQNRTTENNKLCKDALLDVYKNINVLKARFGTL